MCLSLSGNEMVMNMRMNMTDDVEKVVIGERAPTSRFTLWTNKQLESLSATVKTNESCNEVATQSGGNSSSGYNTSSSTPLQSSPEEERVVQENRNSAFRTAFNFGLLVDLKALISELPLLTNKQLDSADAVATNESDNEVASQSGGSSSSGYDTIASTPPQSSPEEEERMVRENRHSAFRNPFNFGPHLNLKVIQLVWEGKLPIKIHLCAVYSTKVFLGGIPYLMPTDELMKALAPFGSAEIQWAKNKGGHVYVSFSHDSEVKSLLSSCTHKFNAEDGDTWRIPLTSQLKGTKTVQVIPWLISDNNFVNGGEYRAGRDDLTVFVGGIPGAVNAEGLAIIMRHFFGDVVYVGLDTDKQKYPIGSGRVAFGNLRSYINAVQSGCVMIKIPKLKPKRVQIDPYLAISKCSCCHFRWAPLFCRHWMCLDYFCRPCWARGHRAPRFVTHKAMVVPKCNI